VAPAGDAHDGRLPPRGVAAPAHVVDAQPRLVAPVDLGALGAGPGGDLGIVLSEPLLDGRGRLLARLSQGLLRREAPARQVQPHGPHRQCHGAVLPDELTHRRTAPQRPGQLHLVGGLGGHDLAHRHLLHQVERAALALRASAGGVVQALVPMELPALADVEDARAAQARLAGDVVVAATALAQADDLHPALVAGIAGERSHVGGLHQDDMGRGSPTFKLGSADSIM
jgi:hypothetical protein